jgi:hypothetical protein
MATATINAKQEAHELIDRMAPEQVSAVVGLLKVMVDPEAQRLAAIPYEDEPISEEEERAVAAAKEWLNTHEPIPNEIVLAEYGLTPEDFERMGRTPLEEPFVPGR